jgi:uncharacterized protein YllA (UPF0747 family)
MINILPDSGLPIKEEIKRNIDDLVNSCREAIKSSHKDLSDEVVGVICEDAKTIFLKRFGPGIRKQIKAIRGKEIC